MLIKDKSLEHFFSIRWIMYGCYCKLFVSFGSKFKSNAWNISQDKTNKDDGEKTSEEEKEGIKVTNTNANEKKKEVSEHKKGKSVNGDSGKDSAKKSTTPKKLLLENRNKILSSQVES